MGKAHKKTDEFRQREIRTTFKLWHKEEQNLESCTKYKEKPPQQSAARNNYLYTIIERFLTVYSCRNLALSGATWTEGNEEDKNESYKTFIIPWISMFWTITGWWRQYHLLQKQHSPIRGGGTTAMKKSEAKRTPRAQVFTSSNSGLLSSLPGAPCLWTLTTYSY